MIDIPQQVIDLWDKHHLSEYKRNHCRIVAELAVWFANLLIRKHTEYHIDISLLMTAALLHDVDKNDPELKGERHPNAGVRLLREAGMPEVATLVRSHPLHAILDPALAPATMEEKLLYLADKMVKRSIITVDERFALWRKESLPTEALAELDAAYPKVKLLEAEICSLLGIAPDDIARLVKSDDLSTMNESKKEDL